MKDTQFSIRIKSFIGNFGGAKTVYWGMQNHTANEDGFSFTVCTDNFCGLIMVSVTEPSKQDDFCLSYLSEDEIKKSKEEINLLANRRTIIIQGKEIAGFIDNINKPHRAPQCMIKPDARG